MTNPAPLRVVDTRPAGDDLDASPHSIEAEQCVLGAVMLSPTALAEVRPLLDGSDFYRPAHARIWDAVCALADRGAPVDPLAVGAHIGTRHLATIGGAPYLHTLISRVPAAANAVYWAHMVRDLAYARTVAETGTRLIQFAHLADGDAAELRAKVAAEVAAVTAADRRGWPDPMPLSTAPTLPAFPVWCLPDWAAEYAAAVADLTQTPVDLAGCLALAALAVAAAGNVTVNAGAWSEPTNLFLVMVLPPGNRKSEVYKAMTAPIRAAEGILCDLAAPLIAEATIARKVAEADAERTEKAATDHPDDLDTPPPRASPSTTPPFPPNQPCSAATTPRSKRSPHAWPNKTAGTPSWRPRAASCSPSPVAATPEPPTSACSCPATPARKSASNAWAAPPNASTPPPSPSAYACNPASWPDSATPPSSANKACSGAC